MKVSVRNGYSAELSTFFRQLKNKVKKHHEYNKIGH
jgi:hypothetical protein